MNKEESIIFHSYEMNFIDNFKNLGFSEIHFWSLNKNSESILIRMRDYYPSCYLELPSKIDGDVFEWSEDSYILKLLVDYLKKKFGDSVFIEHTFEERTKIHYFRQNKSPLIHLKFKTLADLDYCTNLVRYEFKLTKTISIKLVALENGVDTIRKLITDKNCKYCQWTKINCIEINDRDRISTKGADKEYFPDATVNKEYFGDWETMELIPSEESMYFHSNPRLLAFDIENYSHNHRSFPKEHHPKDVSYLISAVYQKVGKPETRKKYVIIYGECENIPICDKIIQTNSEVELIEAYVDLINKVDPDIISGYNIFAYDYPYLNVRLKTTFNDWKQCGRIKDKLPTIEPLVWESSAYGKQNINILNMDGRISIDLLPIIRRDFKLDKYDLNTVSYEFLKKKKHDIKPIDIFRAYENYKQKKDVTSIKEMTKIAEYCVQDSELVVELFEILNIWIGLMQFSGVVGVTIMDLFTRGQQVRCYSQIYDEAHNKGFVLDKRYAPHMNYQGAYVGIPVVGQHENVICLDFASLYPTIMIAYNICYSTFVNRESWSNIPEEWCHIIKFTQEEKKNEKARNIGLEEDMDDFIDEDNEEEKKDTITVHYEFRFIKAEIKKGIVPSILEKLLDERKKIRGEMKILAKEENKLKEELKTTTDKTIITNIEKRLDDISLALKVKEKDQLARKASANSTYGFLGAQLAGIMPLIEGALCVTAIGRMSIAKVNNTLKSMFNADIIYGDTDSTMVSIPELTDTKDCHKWGKILMDVINGTKEKIVDGVVIPAKKGLFLSPMSMEFEKAMRLFCIAKKKYCYFLIEENGEFKKDKNGNIIVNKKGLLTARRDNHAFVREIYNNLSASILHGVNFIDNFRYIINKISDLILDKIDPNNLSITRGIGANYKNDGYFIKVFAGELARMGKPVQPGDRISVLYVKTQKELDDPKADVPLGLKMRMIEMWYESQEEEKNPKASDEELQFMYPVENLDYLYYLEHTLLNPIDQLLSTGYKQYLSTYEELGYNPVYSRRHFTSITSPLKMICSIIRDNFDKYKGKLIKESKKYMMSAEILEKLPDKFLEGIKQRDEEIEKLKNIKKIQVIKKPPKLKIIGMPQLK